MHQRVPEPIRLSTGAVVTHHRQRGSGWIKAVVCCRPGGEMTHAEWEEYSATVARNNLKEKES